MGGINLLVNCAGVIGAGRVLGKNGPMAGDFFTRVVHINLIGTFLCDKAAAAIMQTNAPNADGERGVIIHTSSVAAFEGQIGQAAYSATKAAVAGMTLPIARELAMFGIRVCSLAPGIFATPMLARHAAGSAGVARQAGAVPAAPRQARGIRGAGADHLRECPISMAKPSVSMAPSACSRNRAHEQPRSRTTRCDGVRRGRGRRRPRRPRHGDPSQATASPSSRSACSRRARPSARTSLSGAVMEPGPLDALLPEWRNAPLPICVPVTRDEFRWLGAQGRAPRAVDSAASCTTTGNFIISLGGLGAVAGARRPKRSASTCSPASPPRCRCSTTTARSPACRSATWACSTTAPRP